MLINNGSLNTEEFKAFVDKISWTKVPRVLGPNHEDFFYIGRYSDNDMWVSVTLRPTKVMAITETYKNRMPMDGAPPAPGFDPKKLVEWGSSVEVRVDQKFFDMIVEKSEPIKARTQQVLTWE